MKKPFAPAALLLLFTLFFLPWITCAETRYVDDQLYITIRRGKSADHEIIKTIRTGTPLEVIEDGTPYMKVRTQDGQEGYVLSRYISTAIPKNTVIDKLETERDQLSNQLTDLRQRLDETTSQLEALRRQSSTALPAAEEQQAALKKQYGEAQMALQAVTSKYENLLAQSKGVVESTDKLERLNKANRKLNTEVQELRLENAAFRRSKNIRWFLAGAAILLLGWILGRIPKRRRRF